jgi:hypothetical protein
MHHGVGAKRSPRFGARFVLALRSPQRFDDAEVGGRKRVGQVQRAHREVMGGPRSDSLQRHRGLDEHVEVATVEAQRTGFDSDGEPVNRGRARLRQPNFRDRVDAGGYDLARRRETVRERFVG